MVSTARPRRLIPARVLGCNWCRRQSSARVPTRQRGVAAPPGHCCTRVRNPGWSRLEGLEQANEKVRRKAPRIDENRDAYRVLIEAPDQKSAEVSADAACYEHR